MTIIRDALLRELTARFGATAFRTGEGEEVAIFPAAHPEVGDVLVTDDGDEATVVVGHITHGHFNDFDHELANAAPVVAKQVTDFLEELFAGRVMLWKSPSGHSGGWRGLEAGEAPEPRKGARNFLWSGPIVAILLFLATFAHAAEPLVIGETFTIESKVLHETRRINVYRPPADGPLPVLYMPDGGVAEDFVHVTGLVQIGAANGTMRPFLLVGIENTERRRDMTGPTQVESDKKIAPRVGGSAAFRKFLRDELMPYVEAHYRVTKERAIVGESLAGLFVMETLFTEPDLFDTYIAIDPSLWWNDRKLVADAAEHLPKGEKSLWFATSEEPGTSEPARTLTAMLTKSAPASLHWHYEPMPEEHHATIYHPAALRAFRALLH